MGKKIARGIGYAISAVLMVLCVFLIIVSIVFDADGAVGVLGFNVYIAESGEFEAVAQGSAVIARRCEPYDLEEGNLVLYRTTGERPVPKLAYNDGIRMADGVYIISLSDSSGSFEIEQNSFIGKAEYSSVILGKIIDFSLSPFGIIVMAVLPCLALIIYDFIRAAIDNMPPPEVVPQVKNPAEEAPQPAKKIKVDDDGQADYSADRGAKHAGSADDVLFNYAGIQRGSKPVTPRPEPKRPVPAERSAAPEPKPAPKPASAPAPKKSPAAKKPDERPAGGVPAPIAAKAYMDNIVQAKNPVSGFTAEIPDIPKPKNDAFFVQSEAPQIGRRGFGDSRSRSVIELEDALASAGERSRDSRGGKRSSEILAGKSRSELIAEDDDTLDRGRYEVDDILAGIDRRKR